MGAAIGLTRTAAALAGASKLLLEAEETGCACTTISVSLSFTNWRVTSKAEGPESSLKENMDLTLFPKKMSRGCFTVKCRSAFKIADPETALYRAY